MSILLLPLLAVGCGHSPQKPGDTSADAGSDAGDAGPPFEAVCHEMEDVGAGVFTDVTEEMGLGGVVASRYAFADLNGDLYPDLIEHTWSQNARDDRATDPPTILRKLYLNRDGAFFEDVTDESGLFQTRDGQLGRNTQFAVVADVDDDGDLDVFTGSWVGRGAPYPEDWNELMRNDGTAHFSFSDGNEFTDEWMTYSTTSATWADFDRDGKVDLYTGAWYLDNGDLTTIPPDRLYRNTGSGFVDVTEAQGLIQVQGWAAYDDNTHPRPSYGVTACDVNDDGDLDLLSSAYGRQWNLLWQAHGDGTFSDQAVQWKFHADDQEDYTDNEMYRCYCRDTGACSEPLPVIDCSTYVWVPGRDDQPWRLGGNTFGTACADVDNDGDMDLYNTEIRHFWAGSSADASRLLVNAGDHFERPDIEATGLGHMPDDLGWNEGDFHADFFDYDADGRLDLYVCSSNYPDQHGHLFHQGSDGTFEDVAGEEGIDYPNMTGIATADIDRDGDVDFIVGADHAYLLRNETNARRNGLEIRLVGGERTNRAAIGARIRVTTPGGTQTHVVSGGYGHFGIVDDLVQHFGLADACSATVEVRWPDASLTTESFEDVPANAFVEIEQGHAPRYRHLPF
jgi:hypothetical protein